MGEGEVNLTAVEVARRNDEARVKVRAKAQEYIDRHGPKSYVYVLVPGWGPKPGYDRPKDPMDMSAMTGPIARARVEKMGDGSFTIGNVELPGEW